MRRSESDAAAPVMLIASDVMFKQTFFHSHNSEKNVSVYLYRMF